MERARLRLGILPTLVRHYMTFGGFWIFDDREAQIETYSATVRITRPREIAMDAKVFEHYAERAQYGQQAPDQPGHRRPGELIASNFLETLLTLARSFRILCYWLAGPKPAAEIAGYEPGPSRSLISLEG
jgi:hypothetical protein